MNQVKEYKAIRCVPFCEVLGRFSVLGPDGHFWGFFGVSARYPGYEFFTLLLTLYHDFIILASI